jgi:hypothetical protein
MTLSRFLTGLLGGLAVLVLLVLLAHTIAPEPARAVTTPPDIAKDGVLGDPGTPYEEPENGPTGGTDPTDPKPPEGIIGGSGGAPVVSPDAIRPPTRREIDRRWLYLCLQAWRFHLQVLLKF